MTRYMISHTLTHTTNVDVNTVGFNLVISK